MKGSVKNKHIVYESRKGRLINQVLDPGWNFLCHIWVENEAIHIFHTGDIPVIVSKKNPIIILSYYVTITP